MLAMSKDETSPLKHELSELTRSVEELTRALVGDSKLGIDGVVKRLSATEKAIAEVRTWQNKMNIRMAYWAGVGSASAWIVTKGIDYLTNHH